MSAPAEFVIGRHLLGHPGESPADLALHLRLQRPVVYAVRRRLHERSIVHERQLAHHLEGHPRRIRHRSYHFRVPNPVQWLNQYGGRPWLSGDVVAAENDGWSVVPEQWIAYVAPGEEEKAVRAALDVFADFAPREKANLVIRVADPWLRPDAKNPRLVERGQRLLDYAESPLLQLAGGPR